MSGDASTEDAEARVGMLRDLGLNAYESKAYLTTLTKEGLTAAQIADLSGVPRQRVYDVLASLVERGLVSAQPGGRGSRYSATSPQAALGALIDTETARIERLQAATAGLIENLTTVYDEGRRDQSPLDYISVLRGPVAIAERLVEIQSACREEILAFSKPPYAASPQESLDAMGPRLGALEVRSVYEDQVLIDPDMRAAVHRFVDAGEKARFMPEVPLKLVIVDVSTVMFTMENYLAGRNDLTALVIEHASLSRTLKLAFEAVWSAGDDLASAEQRLELDPLSPRADLEGQPGPDAKDTATAEA
jgi:sugar-specific transcriptional regulator TrmB